VYISIQYKFEPTCIFLGSMVTDQKSEGMSKKCIPTERMGKMDKLTTGAGTIEMIRKTVDGGVEEKQIQGNALIDGNGTWCYQIPMNLDYYMTDEYGNFVPSDDKEKGIPTRTRVRFRVSLTDFQSDYENNHLAKVLVPNNPHESNELDYHFGSATYDNDEASLSYRDLFWNKIYTVKQYIPRIQKGNNQRNKKFTGFKQVNVNGGNNPIPYNNMRVNLTFMFVLQCAIIKIIIIILGFINALRAKSSKDKCAAMGDGICPDLENWYFAPRCETLDATIESIVSDEQDDHQSIDYNNRDGARSENYCITRSTSYLMQCVEINLAMEYEVIQFDFYNDWLNGMLYIPHWFVNYRKKRSYLFGLIHRRAKLESCKEDSFYDTRRITQQCALTYRTDANNNYTRITTPKGCKSNSKQKCHKGNGRKSVGIFGEQGGIVHSETTLQNQSVYYFKPAEWRNVNNQSTRHLMFATDIVMIGSLEDCDKDGLPKVFEELTSSTYIMPSNLATTNMDSQAFMYGWSDQGSRCIGNNTPRGDALEIKEQTFENYKEWIKQTDDYEANADYEPKEYPVTEAAGIDWGYNGPGQGDSDLNNLYYPGGHFLGISCFNSQVNIKSCVNLSRICEIGSIMSQRQAFVRKSNDTFEYDYLVPNGLITKFEITDSNFRREFATMNYNRLRTKIDDATQYRKYDLKYVHPINFNGELSGYINQTSKPYYNNAYDDTERTKYPDRMAYTRTIEEPSNDYYYFRMGLIDAEGLNNSQADIIKRKRYLQVGYSGDSTVVAMPQYENSFYFYFGLNDGNTAIDRFFKDFYAPCNTSDEDSSYYEVTVDDDGDVCSGDGVSVTVKITNVDSPYRVKLSKQNGGGYDTIYLALLDGGIIDTNVSQTDGYSETVSHNYSVFKIIGLSSGNYTLTMYAKDYVGTNYSFTIAETVNSQISGIDISVQSFQSTSYDEDYNYNNMIACIRFLNVYPNSIYGFLVATDEKYVFVKTNAFDISSFAKVIAENIDLTPLKKLDASKINVVNYGKTSTYTVPAWKGNDTYYVYLLYPCGSVTKMTKYGDIDVTMDVGLDLYFGDSDCTVNNTNVSKKTDTWPSAILNDSTAYTEKQKWNLKQSLFFKGSLFNPSTIGRINVKTNQTVATSIKGNAETQTIDDIGDNEYAVITDVTPTQYKQGDQPSEYSDISIDMFHLPTSYFNNGGTISNYSTNGYNKDGWATTNIYSNAKLPSTVKTPYSYTYGDTTVKLPSIYRPCYMTAVMLIDEPSQTRTYSIAINNIVTYNKKVSAMKLNGKNITDNSTLVCGEDFNGDYTNLKLFSELMPDTGYTTGDETFSFFVTEGNPGGRYSGDIASASYSFNISCHFPCNEKDTDFYYTDGVKFFYCASTDKTVIADEKAIIEGDNNIGINHNSTVIVENVADTDIVELHCKEVNTNADIIIQNYGTADLINDNTRYKNGKLDADGKTVMDTISLEESDANPIYNSSYLYRHVVIDVNGYDKITMEGNIEYYMFSVNSNGVIRGEQVCVAVAKETIDGVEQNMPIKKTFTPSVAGKVVIWWAANYDDGSKFTVTYDSNGKYNCGITTNKSATIFSAKWLVGKSLYLDYVEVNDSVVLGCKINNVQNKTKRTEGEETYEYVKNISYGRIPKDYSNKSTVYWNGIFGNANYNVIDVSDSFTIEKITEKANTNKYSGSNKMWQAFIDIITYDIQQNVFAIYDDWTKLATYSQTDDEGNATTVNRYSNDHSKIWKYIYPDENSAAIVKYYGKTNLNNVWVDTDKEGNNVLVIRGATYDEENQAIVSPFGTVVGKQVFFQ
jgi:hypothetical protein